jgi:hypothetical protein
MAVSTAIPRLVMAITITPVRMGIQPPEVYGGAGGRALLFLA